MNTGYLAIDVNCNQIGRFNGTPYIAAKKTATKFLHGINDTSLKYIFYLYDPSDTTKVFAYKSKIKMLDPVETINVMDRTITINKRINVYEIVLPDYVKEYLSNGKLPTDDDIKSINTSKLYKKPNFVEKCNESEC